jgi:hypothetical protein
MQTLGLAHLLVDLEAEHLVTAVAVVVAVVAHRMVLQTHQVAVAHQVALVVC